MFHDFATANINALIKSPIKVEEKVEQVYKDLTDKGFTRVGSGGYSQVWAKKDSPVVVKFVDPEESTGYLTFLKEVQKANGNPWLPKVYAIASFIGRGDEESVLCQVDRDRLKYLEKVEHELVGNTRLVTDAREELAALRKKKENRCYEFPYVAIIMERLKPVRANSAWAILDVIAALAPIYKKKVADFLGLAGDFAGMLEAIEKADRNGCGYDLHEGNIMMRDKQIVVIDPIAG